MSDKNNEGKEHDYEKGLKNLSIDQLIQAKKEKTGELVRGRKVQKILFGLSVASWFLSSFCTFTCRSLCTFKSKR